MPSRRKAKPHSGFIFIHQVLHPRVDKSLKLHSRAARSHAAYWGGPAGSKRAGKHQIGEEQGNIVPIARHSTTSSNVDDEGNPDPTEPADTLARRKEIVKIEDFNTPIAPQNNASRSLQHLQPNSLQYLPSLPQELRSVAAAFSAGLPIFDFYGQAFIKQFIMLDHEDYPIMFSGCLLLSFAHSMVLTGQGSKAVLLELKHHVFRLISAKMKSSSTLVSPWYWTAVLALGAPVVCLISQDLPKHWSIAEYNDATMRDDYSCPYPGFADKAQRSLAELNVHRQVMRENLQRTKEAFYDATSLALLRYIRCFFNM
jgi:hypothetical protein